MSKKLSSNKLEKRLSGAEEGRCVKRSERGKVDSHEIKRLYNLSNEPIINQITYNQT